MEGFFDVGAWVGRLGCPIFDRGISNCRWSLGYRYGGQGGTYEGGGERRECDREVWAAGCDALLAFAHESEVLYLPIAYVVAAGDAPTTDATRGASVPNGLTMNTSCVAA